MFGFNKDPLSRIKRGHQWRFHGGIHPHENKAQTENLAISRLPLPNILVIPIKQHSGNAGEIIVKEGQYVKKGQPLTLCLTSRDLAVHAPTSGTIKSIQYYTACHPSGFKELAILLEPDDQDQWIELNKIEDFHSLEVNEIINKIRDAAIVGMGGAGFPAHAKIKSALGKTKILIINGCECEPYLTCDDRLMQEKADEIILGVQILQYVLKPEIVLIAIEDNKPNAIKAMQKAAQGKEGIVIRILPTLYPSGAARPLIKILTGYEVGYTHRSTDFGVMMQNVASTYYIKRAVIDGEPSIERVVTITGENFQTKANVIIPNGTLVKHIVNHFKLTNSSQGQIILGGPMMGFSIGSLSVPLIKTVNCIIAPAPNELPYKSELFNCIKCGKCQHVCPSLLTPYKMYGHVKSGNIEAFEKCFPRDCIECGCCSYVCPSKIPLVEYFRIGKAEIKKRAASAARKDQIKFDTNAKLEQIKFEQESRTKKLDQLKKNTHEQGSENVAKKKVEEALARAKAAKAQASNTTNEQPKLDPKELAKQKALALAQAKAKAQALKDAKEQSNTNTQPLDPKEVAKQRALQIAKAKAQALKDEKEQVNTNDQPLDPKEAAKQRALQIAKAKAQALKDKKEQANTNDQPLDPKEAAKQKALQIAKAKAQALKDAKEQSNTNDQPLDPREAAKQKALQIAKAKAQALKEQKEQSNTNEQPLDPREAAKQKALQIAKAKKEAREQNKLQNKDPDQ